jgi:hypothetical protein
MHDNALGPEICGQPRHRENYFYRNSYVDARGKPLPTAQAPACWTYDPSVEGRFKLYVASMQALLHPAQRPPKITHFDVDVPLSAGLRLVEGGKERQLAGLSIMVPAGSSSARLGNFQHKQFLDDVVGLRLHPDALQRRLKAELGPREGSAVFADLRVVADQMLKDPSQLVQALRKHPRLFEAYSSCTDEIENEGHRFGEDLSEVDKQALIAVLATL